jgi:hypothetical protein
METLGQIKSLHEKVQNNMFRILADYDVLSQNCSTLQTRLPLYNLAENLKFFFFEVESEVKPYINAINRLLETGYLKIVSDSSGTFLFFIRSKDFDALTEEEKEYLIDIPEQNFISLFKKRRHFSFLDEIL